MAGARPWGRHCLTDGVAKEIVQTAHLGRGDLVLDIGAGSGALTKFLAATGARVVAIELHPKRVAELRARFDSVANVKVVRADAFDLWLPHRPFHVVSNPPFAVTSSLMSRLLAGSSQLVAARLVLQRAAARRYAAGIVRASRSGRDFDITVERLLPRSAFIPPPSVDTALLRIERLRAAGRYPW